MPQWFAERAEVGKRHRFRFTEFAALRDAKTPALAPVLPTDEPKHIQSQPPHLPVRRHCPVSPAPPAAPQTRNAPAATPVHKPTGKWLPTPRGKGLKLRRRKREAVIIPKQLPPRLGLHHPRPHQTELRSRLGQQGPPRALPHLGGGYAEMRSVLEHLLIPYRPNPKP